MGYGDYTDKDTGCDQTFSRTLIKFCEKRLVSVQDPGPLKNRNTGRGRKKEALDTSNNTIRRIRDPCV